MLGTISNERPARIPELDGLRAIAVILVLLWHYVYVQLVIATPSTDLALLRTTWSGVDLFLVLSGFLIGGVIIDNRNASNFFLTFYVRRACRILPAYFILLASFFAITSLHWGYNQWLFGCDMTAPSKDCISSLPSYSYVLFVQNFFMGTKGTFGPNWLGITWSLAIEEQFYVVAPLLLIFLPNRLMLPILAAMFLAAPLARYFVGGLGAYVYTYCRTDALLLGVLAAAIVRRDSWHLQYRLWRWILSGAFLVLAIGTAGFTRNPTIGGAWIHSWFAVLYADVLLLAMAYRNLKVTSALRCRALGWIGERSYAIYLFHQAMAGSLHAVLAGGNAPMIFDLTTGLVTLASLCATLLVADLSFQFFERPLQRLGHRFEYNPASRVPPQQRRSSC